ncbi:DUF563 domain-containing protein [Candidatus Planktophila sulfonica]|uniref:DUF563 domain-containing protein n=2 Tax=Candidatus Planktophila sulfonica TaxID=1884904 RepID=A0A249KF15_9ACTN|nr:DUF563 domain-containing protein [Candidatus Planktophila sulfonica]
MLAVTKITELIFSRKWAKFTLRYGLPLDLRNNESLELNISDFNCAYVSREVARFGFPTNEIGNTLEYELSRNWKKYNLLFTRGRLKLQSIEIPSPKSKPLVHIPEIPDLIDKYLPGNYLTGFLGVPKKETVTSFERVKFCGSVHLNSEKRLKENYFENWSFLELFESTVIHGKIAFSDGKFYTGDDTKVPSFGSSFNSWPGFLYQRIDNTYVTEAKYPVEPGLGEAFMLGGTKNWMHFVIEDLSRLFIFDSLDLSNEIPLLVSSELGLQILESIKALTSRPIILLEPNSYLKVKKLHVLQFNNPLFSTMAGDQEAGLVLFNAELLHQARGLLSIQSERSRRYPSRVLIRREAGLFRPLINASQVQQTLETSFGFESYYLSDLSLQEISSIFSAAEIVVGEYGAGLANIIFCAPGCKILELRGELESGAREYQVLAQALGLDHSFVMGRNRLISRFGISRGPYKIQLGSIVSLLNE